VIRERFLEYKREHPRAWLRDVASALGVSEVELVHAECGVVARPLRLESSELLGRLPELGLVKTMTRNQAAVMEKWGPFENVEVFGKMAQVLGERIDLRLFLQNWGSLYAVEETRGDDVRKSLQLFDVHGDSVQKIYVEPESDATAHERILADFAFESKKPPQIRPKTTPKEKPDSDLDVATFQTAWDAMQDTHEFYHLLGRFGVTRTQALRLAGEARAVAVDPRVIEPLLRGAAESSLSIMIFVGNAGGIQIHTGAVHRIARMHGFLNVLDPEFNLHLEDSLVATAWVVRKPTSDGIVTSLEAYARDGTNLALFFGKRKPGMAENEAWRELLNAVVLG
jgi:putative hemin transport protein